MYATAHRLVSPLEEEGINAFLHLHGAQFPWPDDPGPLAKTNPGELEERSSELPPGGNRVRSFLDVLAPDGTGRAEVGEAVEALAAELEGRANPTWFERGRVTLHFGVEQAIEVKGLDARVGQLRALARAVDQLMARRSS